MNKIGKCTDCSREGLKINKEGLCEYCSSRKTNSRYYGRQYIPINQLPPSDRQYKTFITKFGIEPPKATTPIEKDNNNITKDSIYELVTEDIKKNFADCNLSTEYLKIDIKQFIDLFFSLFQTDNYFRDVSTARTIFNRLSSDYIHQIEVSDWFSQEYTKMSMCEKALIELRRPTENLYASYEIIKPIFEYLNNDERFKELLEEAREKLIDVSKIKPTDYRIKASFQENNLNFIRKTHKYNTSVMCWGLYGNKGATKFERYFYATDTEQAKKMLEKYIEDNFDNITFKANDIQVEEVVE